MLFFLAAAAFADPTSFADPAVSRMVSLYDEVCLKAFPDDKAVAQLLTAKGATELTPEQVRVTLRDDPGRAWLLPDGERQVQVTLELPPYHACSVRRTTAGGFGDLGAYRAVVGAYKTTRPGFVPVADQNFDRDGIHIHAGGELRPLPDGSHETLYLFDQRVIDPERRARGETAVDIRFLHQIIAPGAH